jgi:hypothetical protein
MKRVSKHQYKFIHVEYYNVNVIENIIWKKYIYTNKNSKYEENCVSENYLW